MVNVGMSWNLGVKPARTTLSDDAMHSMMSILYGQQRFEEGRGEDALDVPPLRYA